MEWDRGAGGGLFFSFTLHLQQRCTEEVLFSGLCSDRCDRGVARRERETQKDWACGYVRGRRGGGTRPPSAEIQM